MSKSYVKLSPSATLKDATKGMLDGQQKCVLVVANEDLLEGILTYGDIRRYLAKKSINASNGDMAYEDVCREWNLSKHWYY